MTTIPGSLAASSDVTPLSAIRDAVARFRDFSGRSTRAQYWWVALASGLVSSALTQIDVMVIGQPILSLVWAALVLVPGLALSVRRMHDIGKSGKSLLVALIPVVGAILLLVWACRPSEEGRNRWG